MEPATVAWMAIGVLLAAAAHRPDGADFHPGPGTDAAPEEAEKTWTSSAST